MYRFGSAMAEVYEFVSGMSIGEVRLFVVDDFRANNSIEKFRASLCCVAKDNSWLFVTRKMEEGEVSVRRIK